MDKTEEQTNKQEKTGLQRLREKYAARDALRRKQRAAKQMEAARPVIEGMEQRIKELETAIAEKDARIKELETAIAEARKTTVEASAEDGTTSTPEDAEAPQGAKKAATKKAK